MHSSNPALPVSELYAELISKRYYAAFAWALLNAIVDLEASPPRFRKPRLMKGLLTVGDGSNMEAVSILSLLNGSSVCFISIS